MSSWRHADQTAEEIGFRRKHWRRAPFKTCRARGVDTISCLSLGGQLTEHYDLIVIGSGPGGASLAQALAPTGKRILMLERSDYLPREEANWSAQAVFFDGRYQASET